MGCDLIVLEQRRYNFRFTTCSPKVRQRGRLVPKRSCQSVTCDLRPSSHIHLLSTSWCTRLDGAVLTLSFLWIFTCRLAKPGRQRKLEHVWTTVDNNLLVLFVYVPFFSKRKNDPVRVDNGSSRPGQGCLSDSSHRDSPGFHWAKSHHYQRQF